MSWVYVIVFADRKDNVVTGFDKKSLTSMIDHHYEEYKKSSINESSYGEVTVFLLPNDIYAVPILDLFHSYQGQEDFVHVRNLKCSLDICNKGGSKTHALLEKLGPNCPHTILGRFIGQLS